MPLAAEYPFLEILWTMLIFFVWVIWFWTLIAILGDIFRRHDISGWAKAGWTLFVIVLPILGVLVYLGTNGQGMAERRGREIRAAQVGVGPAAEIEQAKQLLDSGAINAQEFEALKRQALAT
jgi:Phospholipase_D-nuclease N-terminal/Short C-terminal domain